MFTGDYISYVKEGNKYVIVQIYEYNSAKRRQHLHLCSIYCMFKTFDLQLMRKDNKCLFLLYLFFYKLIVQHFWKF